MHSKRAQIGETMTWVVATIIIIVILVTSIFISTAYIGGGKNILSFKRTDLLASKSFFSYLSTKDSGSKLVYNQLKTEENLNEFNGNLATNIFLEFYGRDYGTVWLGIVTGKTDFYGEPISLTNDYFKSRPKDIKARNTKGAYIIPSVSDKIKLNEDKYIEFVLEN